MKRFFAASMLFAVCAMAESMTGVIGDSKCGDAHEAKLNAACVKKCVQGGADAVFLHDGKVYKIASDSKDKVTDYLGQKVKVDGNIEGDTVTINSVSAE